MRKNIWRSLHYALNCTGDMVIVSKLKYLIMLKIHMIKTIKLHEKINFLRAKLTLCYAIYQKFLIDKHMLRSKFIAFSLSIRCLMNGSPCFSLDIVV